MASRSALDQDANERAEFKILVNGEETKARAATLAELVDELGYRGRKVATAVNGDFVAEKARSATLLNAGDTVEIVAPRQGG